MKSETIIFKVTAEELKIINKQIKRENFGSKSEFIRKTILDRAKSWEPKNANQSK